MAHCIRKLDLVVFRLKPITFNVLTKLSLWTQIRKNELAKKFDNLSTQYGEH